MKNLDVLQVHITVELVKRLPQNAHHATQENIVPLKALVHPQDFAVLVSSVAGMQLSLALK
jgi:hypothetical protein